MSPGEGPSPTSEPLWVRFRTDCLLLRELETGRCSPGGEAGRRGGGEPGTPYRRGLLVPLDEAPGQQRRLGQPWEQPCGEEGVGIGDSEEEEGTR